MNAVRGSAPRKQVQFAIKASKSGDWHVDAASGAPVVSTPSGDLALVEGEYELINRVEERTPPWPPLRSPPLCRPVAS